MENILGHCTFAFLFRRVGLAAFGAVFGYVRAGEDAGLPLQPRALSARCRSELITAAALLAFACVDLAAPVSTSVLASDASPWGYGICRAEAPVELVSDAVRFADCAASTWLDGSARAARRRMTGLPRTGRSDWLKCGVAHVLRERLAQRDDGSGCRRAPRG